MSRLRVLIKVHFYSGDKLCDGDFELRKQGYGLYSPKFSNYLLSYNDTTIEIEIEDQLTLGGFQNLFFKQIWSNYSGEIEAHIDFCFLASDLLYSIDNPDYPFGKALKIYFDPEDTGKITVGLYVCEEAGHYATEGKLNYYFHSREQGKHNEPHVHVYTSGHEYEEPFSLKDGRVLTKNTKMPWAYQKQAKQYILKNKNKLMKEWNACTNGLKIEKRFKN